MNQIDPTFFADVFATRAVRHETHGFVHDPDGNVRCAVDDELVTPNPQWLWDDVNA